MAGQFVERVVRKAITKDNGNPRSGFIGETARRLVARGILPQSTLSLEQPNIVASPVLHTEVVLSAPTIDILPASTTAPKENPIPEGYPNVSSENCSLQGFTQSNLNPTSQEFVDATTIDGAGKIAECVDPVSERKTKVAVLFGDALVPADLRMNGDILEAVLPQEFNGTTAHILVSRDDDGSGFQRLLRENIAPVRGKSFEIISRLNGEPYLFIATPEREKPYTELKAEIGDGMEEVSQITEVAQQLGIDASKAIMISGGIYVPQDGGKPLERPFIVTTENTDAVVELTILQPFHEVQSGLKGISLGSPRETDVTISRDGPFYEMPEAQFHIKIVPESSQNNNHK